MTNYTNKIKTVITTKAPKSTISAISKLPKDYQDLMRENQSFEFGVDTGNTHSFVIWCLNGRAGALEMNKALEVQENFGRDSFAIGSDNGDRLILYVRENDEYGLYLVEDYDIDLDDAVFLAQTLTDLLVNGQNIELIHA